MNDFITNQCEVEFYDYLLEEVSNFEDLELEEIVELLETTPVIAWDVEKLSQQIFNYVNG